MFTKRLLAVITISLASGAASANMVTVDAGNFSFSYDDSFWGGATFKQNGGLFTFSNLASKLGTSASAEANSPWGIDADGFSLPGSARITITADAGYTLQSVTSGATGSLHATAGVDRRNTFGSFASAAVGMGTLWMNESGGGHFVEDVGLAGTLYEVDRGPSGGVHKTGRPGAFNISDTTNFSSNVTTAAGLYDVWGGVLVGGKRSSALAFQNSAYFNISVVPAVPEPETWAMFLAGIGMLGAIARRRKSAV